MTVCVVSTAGRRGGLDAKDVMLLSLLLVIPRIHIKQISVTASVVMMVVSP